MLAALAVAFSLATGADPKPASVVAVPFGTDTASTALFAAVDAAVPRACSDRGLGSVRADSVKPVLEALKACKDDGCRVKNARRLGARWAVLGAVDHGALVLRLIDTEVGDAANTVRVEGAPPAVLVQTPAAVDALIDRIAPLAEHKRVAAVARAQRARAAGDLDGADVAYMEAVASAPHGPDPQLGDLWLARARVFDADPARSSVAWDALAGAVGPGAPAFAALDAAAQKRVADALHDHLVARAAGQKPEDAARTHLRLASLYPDSAAAETFAAAELFADAGLAAEARPLFAQLAADEKVDADLRLRALARSRALP